MMTGLMRGTRRAGWRRVRSSRAVFRGSALEYMVGMGMMEVVCQRVVVLLYCLAFTACSIDKLQLFNKDGLTSSIALPAPL